MFYTFFKVTKVNQPIPNTTEQKTLSFYIFETEIFVGFNILMFEHVTNQLNVLYYHIESTLYNT